MGNKDNLEYKDQKIIDIPMEKEVKKSFIDYSMSVITSRALPDVRDGMKPGQRRILYAMYEDRLTYDKPFRKSATTVGNVLGRYHPHGDAAVYQTMVRMAQPFSYRYPLVQGHGNFGNVDGDGAAAYRYTEARLARISDHMTTDIEKDVVDFAPNFDNRLKEPRVLPSRFPNLLVNGSVGIAVGMATNIPPHNLGEIIDGTIFYMENPDAGVPELLEYIKGPDFPTHATICGTSGIYEAYSTGRGRIRVRAKAEVDEEKHRIIITEIPYMVNKSQLIENMAGLVKDKRIEGITELRDESGRNGMRIVVEHRRDANGQIILNQLYKYTQLQDTCAVNMLALVDGQPRILNLMEILGYYIKFQEEVITRRTQFELDRALREMHIYEGYKIALDNIDKVIETIRGSDSIPQAKAALIELFELSEVQAQAIVDMTLGRLSGLERQKIEDRLVRLAETVENLQGILADGEKIKAIVKEELLEIKRLFADPRRTEITESEEDIILEDLIPRHKCVITMTHAGYIKRQPATTYSAQRRGGKGIIGMSTKEEDFIENVIIAESHSYLMLFTNTGKVHNIKVYRIPEASRTARGSNIVNILELTEEEKITAVISVAEFAEGEYLTMVTKRGIIKRTFLTEYEYQRRGGKIALTLDEGDELVFVRHTKGECELIIATRYGLAVRFAERNVRSMGRTARGVIGIRLAGEDEVAGVALVDDSKHFITITESGYGKRSPFEDFRSMKNRGGRGVTCHRISDKTGLIASVSTVAEEDDIMMITNDGTIIRTPVAGIPIYSRSAGGVIVMRLSDGASIVNFAKVPSEETDDEEIDSETENADTEDTEDIENIEDTADTAEPEDATDAENTEPEEE